MRRLSDSDFRVSHCWQILPSSPLCYEALVAHLSQRPKKLGRESGFEKETFNQNLLHRAGDDILAVASVRHSDRRRTYTKIIIFTITILYSSENSQLMKIQRQFSSVVSLASHRCHQKVCCDSSTRKASFIIL